MNSITIALGAFVLLCGCVSQKGPQMTTLADITPSKLIGEWNVEQIEGASVTKESDAFIGFDGDGRLHGNASVNKLVGSWSLTSRGLQLGNLGTTRMAGPKALMDQESRLLTALGRVARAQRRIDGWLVLVSEDGDSLVTASARP